MPEEKATRRASLSEEDMPEEKAKKCGHGQSELPLKALKKRLQKCVGK